VYFSQDGLEGVDPPSKKGDVSRQPANPANDWEIASDGVKARATTGGVGSSCATP